MPTESVSKFNREWGLCQNIISVILLINIKTIVLFILFHLVRFCAMFLISFQLIWASSSPDMTVLLHVFLGRPFFLFPCGFHSSAWRAMDSCDFLSVWTIHLHFLCLIVWASGWWWYLASRFSLYSSDFCWWRPVLYLGLVLSTSKSRCHGIQQDYYKMLKPFK